MGLTPAPVGAWFLAWIALVPLWLLVTSNLVKHQFSSLLIGAAWGVGYHGIALSWITGVHPMTWMGVPWLASLAIALLCWLFITLWGAVLVALWAVGMGAINWQCQLKSSLSVGLWRVLAGTALWCLLERVWSMGPLWWTSLSYTQSPHNLAILHLGQLSGPAAVTAAIVAVNGLIAEAVQRRWQLKAGSGLNSRVSSRVYLYLAAAALIGLHLLGFALYTRPLFSSKPAVQVGIIQGNVPNHIKLYPEGLRRAIKGYTDGYKALAKQGVEAVLTPEGALPFFQSRLLDSAFIKAVQEEGVVAWVGAFGERGNNYSNSLFTITGTGKISSRYDKVNLVPIGEYVPFENIIGGLVERLSPLDEHQVAGEPNQILATPFGKVIAGICYDSTYSEHFRRQAARGGEFILSASNNAHYSEAMPAQHHAQDVLRAIETDRWAVRATNTGYSAIVNPHGRTLWKSRLNTYETHADTIYRQDTQTLYVRWGDWLTLVLLGTAILWGILIQLASRY